MIRRLFSTNIREIIRLNTVKLIERIFGTEIRRKIILNDHERRNNAFKVLTNVKKQLLKLSEPKLTKEQQEMFDTLTEDKLNDYTTQQLKLIGDYKFKGEIVQKDLNLAVKAWKLAGERGDLDAAYSYAAALRIGSGCIPDKSEAFRILQDLSRTKNHAFSTHACGIMLEQGEGVPIDYKAAFEYYEIAAHSGIPLAMFNLGNMYASGKGCEQNYEKAFNCYAVASNSDQTSKFLYAKYLYDGIGCQKDIETAITIFDYLVVIGSFQAAHFLGMHHLEGKNAPVNFEEGCRYLNIASSIGFYQSSYNLGLIFYEGNGTERNLLLAKQYFSLAYEQNKQDPSPLEYLQAIETELKEEKQTQQN